MNRYGRQLAAEVDIGFRAPRPRKKTALQKALAELDAIIRAQGAERIKPAPVKGGGK